MSQTISTVGDKTTHGGTIISGSPTRKIQGKTVARVGDIILCPIHGKTKITIVSGRRPRTDGKHTAHEGAIASCGAKILKSNHRSTQGMTDE